MNFEIKTDKLAEIVEGKITGDAATNQTVNEIIIDSRHLKTGHQYIFVALTGPNHNGHDYIKEIYLKGGRIFLVDTEIKNLPEAVQIIVPDTLVAIQDLAAWYRKQFKGKVIGITGSNGKTMVKEWLSDLLHSQFSIYKSPKSYNSQIGVPLSVLNAPVNCDYYLFETGISKPGEMQKLERIIKPDFGVFTHFGNVHRENFKNENQHAKEKTFLFTQCKLIFMSGDAPWTKLILNNLPKDKVCLYSSFNKSAASYFSKLKDSYTSMKANGKEFKLKQIYSDDILGNNLLLSLHAAAWLGVTAKKLQETVRTLGSVTMRLEWIQGINGCSILNDSWTNDPDALNAALDFIKRTKKQEKTILILSAFGENYADVYYEQALNRIVNHLVSEVFLIGKEWNRFIINSEKYTSFRVFESTSEFLKQAHTLQFREAAILIKGSRKFKFERIVEQLEEKSHQTVLEINLDALAQNFQLLKRKSGENLKVMAMVKAFAYGSGNYEVARLLQYHRADYLAVAFTDEGVALRQAGIQIPIMVLNAEPDQWENMAYHQLEPVVYSIENMKQYLNKSEKHKPAIHLEIDTGMHRLGFTSDKIQELVETLKNYKQIEIKSIFTHLAAADIPECDDFTRNQSELFHKMIKPVLNVLPNKPLLHISNTSGAIRFGSFETSMVRLGIGMYGIDTSGNLKEELMNVFTFKTQITQIKQIKKGESIGYSRSYIAGEDMRIAIIPVGYADGFSRKFSNGKGFVLINGKRAPVCGHVCMDMTMVDVTEIDCKEKDKVTLFGQNLPVSIWAQTLETIPYEVLTSISQRVKRVFLSEL